VINDCQYFSLFDQNRTAAIKRTINYPVFKSAFPKERSRRKKEKDFRDYFSVKSSFELALLQGAHGSHYNYIDRN
jgi:hypothetical protein